MRRRVQMLLAASLLVGCGATADGTDGGDPCAPHGHIHRDPEGDWCHCDRGFLASNDGPGCVPDPEFLPRDGGFNFGDDGEHACFHISNGPYATVTSTEDTLPRVDAFHTLYTAHPPLRHRTPPLRFPPMNRRLQAILVVTSPPPPLLRLGPTVETEVRASIEHGS